MKVFPARFFDGRTAASRDVFVRADKEGLRLFEDAEKGTAAEGVGFAYWPYGKVRTIGPIRGRQAVHFARLGPDMLRLSVDDPDFAEHLAATAPRFVKREAVGGKRQGKVPLGGTLKWVGGGAAVAGILAVLWFHLPEAVARIIPRSWETALGDQAVEQLALFFGKGEARWCESPEGTAAIARLTGKLADAADTGIAFRVRVLKSPTVNAFAVPGDQIVLIQGMIDLAKHPNELAGVLAHEMAHVIRRHPTQNMVRASGLQMIAGTILGGDTSGDLLVATGEALVLLKYSRDAEQEADDIARKILHEAGFGVGGLNSFFRRLDARLDASAQANAFLSTHPPLRDRITADVGEATPSQAALTPEEWRAVQTMCR